MPPDLVFPSHEPCPDCLHPEREGMTHPPPWRRQGAPARYCTVNVTVVVCWVELAAPVILIV